MNQYGPAVVLGCLIGAAIILDDVITPSVPTRLMSIEARDVSTLHTEPHVKMSIQKSKENAAAASKDIEIVVITDQAPVGEDDHGAVNINGVATAEIAVKAAQTGHMVMSTLHTNSACETITRLLNMGVPAFNVATSINLIIAQRLARIQHRLVPALCHGALGQPIQQ